MLQINQQHVNDRTLYSHFKAYTGKTDAPFESLHRERFGHGANAYSHSQRPVPRSFSLFKRYEGNTGQLNRIHLNVTRYIC